MAAPILPHSGLHPDGTLVDPDDTTGAVQTYNSALALFDEMQNGELLLDCTAGGTITPASADVAAASRIVCQGTPAAAYTVEIPAEKKTVDVKNETGFRATFQVVGGAGVSVGIPAGEYHAIYCDDTDVEKRGNRHFVFPTRVTGAPQISTEINAHLFAVGTVFKSGLPGSVGSAGTAPSAQTDFDIRKGVGSVGTIRFAASSTVATFIMASDTVFESAEKMSIQTPGNLNGLEDLLVTLLGEN